jgi:phosphonoacetate hydrolase
MSVTLFPFAANGRTYAPPVRPVVVICLDGSSDEYLDAAKTRGLMPNLQRMAVEGFRGLARAAMPTFTNVNNSSIITGVPPSVHGIGGNYFLNPDTGEEVMMNSSQFLRAETITASAHRAGRKVAIVTAKEKLRDILGAGLLAGDQKGVAISAEKVDQARPETHGFDGSKAKPPHIYSGEASLYVLRAGVDLIRNRGIDFAYLSTTDFIQHKYAPEDREALEFYREIDKSVGELIAAGALVGITADHGMNAKQRADGSPNVVYLEGLLHEKFGAGFRVVLPITDPYVLHHGALGSFAVVHAPAGADLRRVAEVLLLTDGITEVMDRATAAKKLELPADRLGELVVISGRDVVLGLSPEKHDLKAVETGLRSHGGRYEEMVPFLFSAPLNEEYAQRARGDVRNFDVFDFVCNGLQS